jgi:hypothetical protein
VLCTKLNEFLYQMCLTAGFLGNFETAQGSELHVQIANSARSAANSAQQLQELFLFPIAGREEPQKESLQAAASGPEAVNGFGIRLGCESDQGAIHPLENEVAALARDAHSCIKSVTGKNRRSFARSGKVTAILTRL